MFSQHPKCKFWSKRNEKNPSELCLNSHKKFWFDCDKCSHEFESSLLNINQSNTWCPYCSNKKLCDNKECNICFEKSFASNEKAIYWSHENILNPRDVFKSADRKNFIFNCDKCQHSLLLNLKSISSQGHWCSYCSHQKLCDNEECNMCFDNSFASVERNKYWSKENILTPRQVFKSTNKKISFDCDICNKIFCTQLSGITKGIWCPYCVNKTEQILFDKLKVKYNLLKFQYKVEWCKNINYLPFDFVIEDIKLIIELDGKQHFEQIGKWLSPDKTHKNDLYKMKCANDNGFSIIRILQKDVYKNKYNWLDELISNIEKITNENRVQNIYMCKNNEYKDFDM